jgi:casein kinase I homolog HRR25
MVMTLLGRSLDSLLRKCGGKFSLECFISVSRQLLERVEIMHKKNYVKNKANNKYKK